MAGKAAGKCRQNAGNQVAERVLRREADDQRDHADAGQRGRAQAGQGRDKVRVGGKGENIDTVANQFRDEFDRHAVNVFVLVVR